MASRRLTVFGGSYCRARVAKPCRSRPQSAASRGAECSQPGGTPSRVRGCAQNWGAILHAALPQDLKRDTACTSGSPLLHGTGRGFPPLLGGRLPHGNAWHKGSRCRRAPNPPQAPLLPCQGCSGQETRLLQLSASVPACTRAVQQNNGHL